MLLPAVQYGDWKTVRARTRKIIAQLKRGASFVEAMTRDGMLETADTDGFLVVMGIQGGSAANFHCFMPWKDLWDVVFDMRTTPTSPSALEDAIVDASLQTAWGILGLLSHESQSWVFPPKRHEPLLHAAIAAWKELDSVGPRYYAAVQGERLWSVPNNLHYVLANMGVPNDVLRAPLPPDGPAGLLRYVRQGN